jgi:two-component system, NtrC family, nitrogen regulation response regulator NtrX
MTATLIPDDAPRILVVEDEPATADLLGHIFEVDGYRVLQANDGARALELARAKPGVLAALVDLELPWMDGRALIEELRNGEDTKDVRIIVVSGARDARTLNADAVVEKPLSRDRLREVLHRVHEWVPLPPESRSATPRSA